MFNVRPGDRISAEKLGTRLTLKNMREYLKDRRLQWFGHLERWKNMFGLVNVELSRLTVASPKHKQRKHGMR